MERKARVLSFLRARACSSDWTQQELAEFYRVESALLQNGLFVGTDRGRSDEGDPWFIFYRSESEEVIAHFARFDGYYLVASSAFSGIARGRDFQLLVRELMEAHPLMLPRNHGPSQKVFLHPSALLAALLATSYLISSKKDALIQEVSGADHEKGSGFWQHLGQDLAILTAVTIAAIMIESPVEFTLNLAQDPAADALAAADPAFHASDADFLDHTAQQALHDNDVTTLRGASDLMQHFALESRNPAHEPRTLSKGSDHPTVTNTQELTAALNTYDNTTNHADTAVKDGNAVTFNNADILTTEVPPEQVLADLDATRGGRTSVAASSFHTNLDSASIFPANASLTAANNAFDFAQANPPANVPNQIVPSEAGIAPIDIAGLAVSTASTEGSVPVADGTQGDGGTHQSSAEIGLTTFAATQNFKFTDLLLRMDLKYAVSSEYSIAASMSSIASVRNISLPTDASGPAVDSAQTSAGPAPQASLQAIATALTPSTLSVPNAWPSTDTSALVVTGAPTPHSFPLHASLHDITIADMQLHGIVGIVPHVAASTA
jgi:hypothetical protein